LQKNEATRKEVSELNERNEEQAKKLRKLEEKSLLNVII